MDNIPLVPQLNKCLKFMAYHTMFFCIGYSHFIFPNRLEFWTFIQLWHYELEPLPPPPVAGEKFHCCFICCMFFYLKFALWFSNSLIIHGPQSNHTAGCGSVYRVWYLVKHSVSCFHLASDGRGGFMSCASVFASNQVPDEGTIESDEDHCGKWENTATGQSV